MQDENFPELCSTFLSFQTQKVLGHPLPTAPKGGLSTMESILKALSWRQTPSLPVRMQEWMGTTDQAAHQAVP